jgi:trehalose-phosphatase
VTGGALARLVRPVFDDFVTRTPGSAVENKRAAIAWHYRAADPEYGAFQARELLTRLEDILRRRPYKVLRGSKVIEVRHEHVTKGSALLHLLEQYADADFLFCAGDDRTDEDMMRAGPQSWQERSITCWVGSKNVFASYWRESNDALLTELEHMVRLWKRVAATPPKAPRAHAKKSNGQRVSKPSAHKRTPSAKSSGKTRRKRA